MDEKLWAEVSPWLNALTTWLGQLPFWAKLAVLGGAMFVYHRQDAKVEAKKEEESAKVAVARDPDDVTTRVVEVISTLESFHELQAKMLEDLSVIRTLLTSTQVSDSSLRAWLGEQLGARVHDRFNTMEGMVIELERCLVTACQRIEDIINERKVAGRTEEDLLVLKTFKDIREKHQKVIKAQEDLDRIAKLENSA
jgi:hypothetical protein